MSPESTRSPHAPLTPEQEAVAAQLRADLPRSVAFLPAPSLRGADVVRLGRMRRLRRRLTAMVTTVLSAGLVGLVALQVSSAPTPSCLAPSESQTAGALGPQLAPRLGASDTNPISPSFDPSMGPTTNAHTTPSPSTLPSPPTQPPPDTWTELPLAARGGIDVIDGYEVLHPASGPALPVKIAGQTSIEVHRVRGGWLIMSLSPVGEGSQGWWLMTSHAIQHVTDAATGHMLGTSPDGELLALGSDTAITIHQLPSLTEVARLDTGRYDLATVRWAYLTGERLVFASARLGDSIGFQGTVVWNWCTNRVSRLAGYTVRDVTGNATLLARDGSLYLSPVDDTLHPRRIGNADGSWRLSPDAAQLAALDRPYRYPGSDPPEVVVLPVNDLGAGRELPTRRISLPYAQVSRLRWADATHVTVAVVVSGEDLLGARRWGVVRCDITSGTCERVPLANGDTLAHAVDAVPPWLVP